MAGPRGAKTERFVLISNGSPMRTRCRTLGDTLPRDVAPTRSHIGKPAGDFWQTSGPMLRWIRAATLAFVLAAQPGALLAQPSNASGFDGAAAKQQVDVLAGQIGSRPAGSPAYDQAVEYADSQLQQWGYSPTLQTFGLNVYQDRGSQLDVTDSSGATQHLSANTLQYSVGGQVQARLIAAGQGQAEDFAGIDARGTIALVKRGVQRFSDKVANAANAGAVGVIVYNDSAGPVQGTLAEPEPIPAATISGDAGQQLFEQLQSGPLTAILTIDAAAEQSAATNVIAELPGSHPEAGTVIFTAHLDSVPAGPGANDNGSGSAVVLELARELAQRAPSQRPMTLRFALFGAEELGLDGSQFYVQHLSEADRQALRADINLDMVGVGDQWRFGGSNDLVQLALGAANDLGQRALPLSGPLVGASDHASFLTAGVPAVFLYRVEDPNYHTAGDVASLVDANALGQAGAIAIAIAEQVSGT
jgi:aminopeptidase YwaD